MRIEFIELKQVEDHLGNVIQSYRPGQVVELSAASARHFISRGLAREYFASPTEVQKKSGDVPPTSADGGLSKENGADKPSSASHRDQASASEMSSTSDAQENAETAGLSSSTEVTNEPDGQTSSTEPTRRGGGRRKTRRGSKAAK